MKRTIIPAVFVLCILLSAVVSVVTASNAAPLSLDPHTEKTELYRKKILFAGDSIMSAQKDDYNNGGIAKRIGSWNEMKMSNRAVSGASITTAKDNRIINQLGKGTFDYVILQGGINDAMYQVPYGKITDKDVKTGFDPSTFAGAFEELLAKALELHPTSKIGFIITYSTPNSTWGGRTPDFSKEVELMIEGCEKWGIEYINLYSGTAPDGKLYSKDVLKTNTAENLYNGKGEAKGEIHIGGSGYDLISPYIEDWIINLYSTPETPATTQAPATQAPTTQAPATQAPVTEAPATQTPVTQTPVTQTPATQTSITEATTEPAPERGCACSSSVTGGVSLSAVCLLALAGTITLGKRKKQ